MIGRQEKRPVHDDHPVADILPQGTPFLASAAVLPLRRPALAFLPTDIETRTLSLKTLTFFPTCLALFALFIVSTFTCTTTAPGNDKTVKVEVNESGVGALTIPATGHVTVNGNPVTYTVDKNGSSGPTVMLTNTPPSGATVVISGNTAAGNGGDYTGTATW